MQPLISIVLPVYNGERYLAEAIESCLNQTYRNIELVIINDNSSDNSLEIARHYQNKDNRVLIISNKVNRQLPATLNIGHRAASGSYYTWTSHDNILKSNMLEKLLHTMEMQEVDVVFSNYDVIEMDGSYRRTHQFGPVAKLPFGNTIGASFLYTKELFELLDGYNENLHRLEDYDFWIRASTKFSFYHIDVSLYSYRVHLQSLTSSISVNEHIQKDFFEKHWMVYNHLIETAEWSMVTIEFILSMRNFAKWSPIIFRTHHKIITSDLRRYQDKLQSNDRFDIMRVLDLELRKKILNYNIGCKMMLWYLCHRPKIFYNSAVSIKSSLRFLLKFIYGR